MTESLLDRVPVGNLRVPRAEFGALWAEAERLNDEQTGRPDPDWYPAAVAVTCRWLAGAVVQDRIGRRSLAPSPVSRRAARACEELIEAEYLAAEQLDVVGTHPREQRHVVRPLQHVDRVDLQQPGAPQGPAQEPAVGHPGRGRIEEALRGERRAAGLRQGHRVCHGT